MSEETVDAKGLANLFLDWSADAGIPVSPMKLQKLLFFTHADFLIRTGKPLIKQEFEAWEYGPVIPSLYQEFKKFEDRPITSKAKCFDPITTLTKIPTCELASSRKALAREMFNFYSNLSALHLSELSHEFEGAWRQARSLFSNGMNMDRRISNQMIVTYHRSIHS